MPTKKRDPRKERAEKAEQERDDWESRYKVMTEEYHAIRAASREGLTEEQNIFCPQTISKIRFLKKQYDQALAQLEKAKGLLRHVQKQLSDGGYGNLAVEPDILAFLAESKPEVER